MRQADGVGTPSACTCKDAPTLQGLASVLYSLTEKGMNTVFPCVLSEREEEEEEEEEGLFKADEREREREREREMASVLSSLTEIGMNIFIP